MALLDSALNNQQREEDLASLKTEVFDLLVIGGGVTGAGVALDGASRGLKVALIEAGDLASGTSSRSSKLIHGGLRYLEQYDFKLVKEALREREMMVTTLAPHLVKPVSFLFPLTEKFRERTYVGAGLALYDLLRGFKRALPWHKHLDQKRVAKVAPSLRADIITGGIQYFDAQVDDARHTMMIARTAKRYGARIATYTEATELIRDGKRVVGVKVKPQGGRAFAVKAKVTVLAGGVWTSPLYEKFGLKPGYEVRMSKGAHIVVPGDAISSESGVIIKTPLSVLFIIPWFGKWIVGTTDTEYRDDPGTPVASKSDVDYILAQANRVLTPRLRRSDVIGVYAGLRPLISSAPDSPTTKLSREHIVDRPAPGFVSIAGGKYTTYRVMAEDAVDVASAELRRIVPESSTAQLPLLGADGYFALTNKVSLLASEYALSEQAIRHLLDRYGSEIVTLLELTRKKPELSSKLNPNLEYLKVEAVYAVEFEGARNLIDIIDRRTRISFESDDHGLGVAKDIAEILAKHLGWSGTEKKKQIEEFKNHVKAERAALLTS
ncbi:MAG: glycerol-3-phosphate dehydrogenase/oxidase [Actinobacteria bacterium]|nr:glycerol-3-phosphate dehydrogenase/oxidase [Actinomycetota bacterium]